MKTIELRVLLLISVVSVLQVAAAEDASPADTVRAIPGKSPGSKAVDYAAAEGLPLPRATGYTDANSKNDIKAALEAVARPGEQAEIHPSRPGDGKKVNARRLARKKPSAKGAGEESGTSGLPFSTARADLDRGDGRAIPTNEQWPYRAAGKLFFNDQGKSYVCSASLIDRGLVVTAAHCVSSNAANRLYSDWKFAPGFRDGVAPFGLWEARKAYVLASYPSDATGECIQKVVCRDDVALLALVPQTDPASMQPFLPGDHTGWFHYVSGTQPVVAGGMTHLTQIGYPVCLDDGMLMERNDAQGVTSSDNRDNTVIGSLMCGGSSGGPWIANFGIRPALTGTVDGQFATQNVVIGVTSWGAADNTVKRQGASPFLSNNIDVLVKSACKEYPDVCANE